jgi:hypothetical protein
MGVNKKIKGGNFLKTIKDNTITRLVDLGESFRDQNPAVHKLWDYYYFLIIFIFSFMITFYYTVNTQPIFIPLVAFSIILGAFLLFFTIYNFYYDSTVRVLVAQSNIPIIISTATVILGGLMTFISTVIVLVTMTYIMDQPYSSGNNINGTTGDFSPEKYNMTSKGSLMVSLRNYANIWRFVELIFAKMAIIVPLAFLVMYQNLDDEIVENNLGENKSQALMVLTSFAFLIVVGISVTDMFYSVEILNTKLKKAAGVGVHPI